MLSFSDQFRPFVGPLRLCWQVSTKRYTFWCKGHLSEDSFRLGVGMTDETRSVLVVSVSAADPKTCTIVGLSTYTKANMRKVLPFEGPVLKTLLDLAEALAVSLGCTHMRLYDAANVRIGDSFAFLTRIMLLKRGLRLYERYGYTGEQPFSMPDVGALNGCRLLFRVLSRRCLTWSDVWAHLETRVSVVDDLEALFDDLGFPLETLQCWYTKEINLSLGPNGPLGPLGTVSFSKECLPEFLKSYSDRWMDVY